MVKFDKNKPYGQVYGNMPFTYEQDGKYFLGNGVHCDVTGKPIEESASVPDVQPSNFPPPAAGPVVGSAARRGRPPLHPKATFDE